jgi:hypothetical protein
MIHVYKSHDSKYEGDDFERIKCCEQDKQEKCETRKSERQEFVSGAGAQSHKTYLATQRSTTTSERRVIPSGRMRE